MNRQNDLEAFFKWKSRFDWPFVGVKAKWRADAPKYLKNGLQPGDEELFMTEEFADSEAFSTGACYQHYLKKHPEAKLSADGSNIETISELLSFAEEQYGGGLQGDYEKWRFILTSVRMQTLMSHFIEFESLDEIITRILRIKTKLMRMPWLDIVPRCRIYIFCKDYAPGYLHPKDSAYLGSNWNTVWSGGLTSI